MEYRFKKYWRKTGLNEEWGSILLNLIIEKKPKHFLEIGVFCGVTSRNVCELLNKIHKGDFSYTGVDLFGEKTLSEKNESTALTWASAAHTNSSDTQISRAHCKNIEKI